MEALGQLAGGIAHDINNVLQAVHAGGSLIERRPEDVDGVRRLVRRILTAAERGAAITRRLLSFSRQSELRAEALRPDALLIGMREILAHTMGGGIKVHVDADIDLPSLLADKGQLETVLVNLATNARDAMAGTGIITFSASSKTVDPRHPSGSTPRVAAGEYVLLAVSDTGSGMDAATLARASEPFFTTKPSAQGTGLGLSMAIGFAEQSGGVLQISSTPGVGTTVTVWLPVAVGMVPPSAPLQPGDDGGAARVTKRSHVLLVDDDAIVREVLAESLEAAGLIVRTAASGDEACRLLGSGHPVDVLVSDFSMPGMNGVAVIREAQRQRPALPAILLTGFADGAVETAAGDAGSGSFTLVRKPISGGELFNHVASLLEIATARATITSAQ